MRYTDRSCGARQRTSGDKLLALMAIWRSRPVRKSTLNGANLPVRSEENTRNRSFTDTKRFEDAGRRLAAAGAREAYNWSFRGRVGKANKFSHAWKRPGSGFRRTAPGLCRQGSRQQRPAWRAGSCACSHFSLNCTQDCSYAPGRGSVGAVF